MNREVHDILLSTTVFLYLFSTTGQAWSNRKLLINGGQNSLATIMLQTHPGSLQTLAYHVLQDASTIEPIE